MTLDTFFKKFDQFADAPNAVAKMRELVLQLAVQGKIVSQNPKDEKASILLARIGKTKELLISDRTIRRQETAPIDDSEAPFSIPPSWVWTRLGEIADWGSGSTPSRGNSDLYDGGIAWLKSGELNDNQALAGSEETVTEKALTTGSFRRNKPGDVLLAMYGATIGKVAILAEPAVTNQAVCGCTPFDGVFNRYLFSYLLSQRVRFHSASEGGAQPNISKVKIVAFPFPLPPLAEQKRIVAKVDELMALCDLLEVQQQERDKQASALARASLARFAEAPTPANLNLLFHISYSISPADLRKAILAMAVRGKLLPQNSKDESAEKLFARIHSIKENLIKERTIKRASVEPNPGKDTCAPLPTGWIWTRLGNTFDVRDGTHDTPKYTKEGYPLITSKNIYSGSLLFDGANLISENDHRQICERSKVDRNDILFAMIGSIGNPVVVDTDKEFSIKNVALFKYYEAADSEPGFLLLYLKLVAEEMRAKAAGGVQAFVSLGFLRNYVFPLPPLAEQRRIVAKVDQLMALVDQLETQLAASRATAKNLLEAVVAELTASSSRNHEDLVQAE